MGVNPYEIRFYRGDFYPKILTFVDRATRNPIPIAGMTFILTVNKEINPKDTTNELFKITGVVVDEAAAKVSFTPSATDNDLPIGEYYYDVHGIVGSISKRTLLKGTWVIEMDINKD